MGLLASFLENENSEAPAATVATPATFPRRLDQKSQLPQLSQAPPQKTEFPEASRGASARLAPREEEQSEAPPPNSANSANFPSAWEQKSQLACDSLRLFENRGCAGASRADPLRAEYRRVLDAGPLFDMPLQRWDQFKLDAEPFLRDWAGQALALGWSVDDIFGYSASAPWRRIDKLGLVWLLGGDRIVAMDDRAAHLVNPRGSRHTCYRKAEGSP